MSSLIMLQYTRNLLQRSPTGLLIATHFTDPRKDDSLCQARECHRELNPGRWRQRRVCYCHLLPVNNVDIAYCCTVCLQLGGMMSNIFSINSSHIADRRLLHHLFCLVCWLFSIFTKAYKSSRQACWCINFRDESWLQSSFPTFHR